MAISTRRLVTLTAALVVALPIYIAIGNSTSVIAELFLFCASIVSGLLIVVGITVEIEIILRIILVYYNYEEYKPDKWPRGSTKNGVAEWQKHKP